MVRVRTSLSFVSSSATWSSLITDRQSLGARPAQRTFTPSSFISSRRRRITSRLKPIRNLTSAGERVQFSVENAYAEIALTPISIAPSTTSNRLLSPCSCPTVRGSPRAFAQRPLPSMMIATCAGTRSFGTAGGRTPEGCGSGGRTGMVLGVRRGTGATLVASGGCRGSAHLLSYGCARLLRDPDNSANACFWNGRRLTSHRQHAGQVRYRGSPHMQGCGGARVLRDPDNFANARFPGPKARPAPSPARRAGAEQLQRVAHVRVAV